MFEDYITLSYNNIKKEIKPPETFCELKEIFFKEFNEDKTKHFRFYYLDDEEDENPFDNDSNYIEALDELKQQRFPIIKIEKRDNEEIDNKNNVVNEINEERNEISENDEEDERDDDNDDNIIKRNRMSRYNFIIKENNNINLEKKI